MDPLCPHCVQTIKGTPGACCKICKVAYCNPTCLADDANIHKYLCVMAMPNIGAASMKNAKKSDLFKRQPLKMNKTKSVLDKVKNKVKPKVIPRQKLEPLADPDTEVETDDAMKIDVEGNLSLQNLAQKEFDLVMDKVNTRIDAFNQERFQIPNVTEAFGDGEGRDEAEKLQSFLGEVYGPSGHYLTIDKNRINEHTTAMVQHLTTFFQVYDTPQGAQGYEALSKVKKHILAVRALLSGQQENVHDLPLIKALRSNPTLVGARAGMMAGLKALESITTESIVESYLNDDLREFYADIWKDMAGTDDMNIGLNLNDARNAFGTFTTSLRKTLFSCGAEQGAVPDAAADDDEDMFNLDKQRNERSRYENFETDDGKAAIEYLKKLKTSWFRSFATTFLEGANKYFFRTKDGSTTPEVAGELMDCVRERYKEPWTTRFGNWVFGTKQQTETYQHGLAFFAVTAIHAAYTMLAGGAVLMSAGLLESYFLKTPTQELLVQSRLQSNEEAAAKIQANYANKPPSTEAEQQQIQRELAQEMNTTWIKNHEPKINEAIAADNLPVVLPKDVTLLGTPNADHLMEHQYKSKIMLQAFLQGSQQLTADTLRVEHAKRDAGLEFLSDDETIKSVGTKLGLMVDEIAKSQEAIPEGLVLDPHTTLSPETVSQITDYRASLLNNAVERYGTMYRTIQDALGIRTGDDDTTLGEHRSLFDQRLGAHALHRIRDNLVEPYASFKNLKANILDKTKNLTDTIDKFEKVRLGRIAALNEMLMKAMPLRVGTALTRQQIIETLTDAGIRPEKAARFADTNPELHGIFADLANAETLNTASNYRRETLDVFRDFIRVENPSQKDEDELMAKIQQVSAQGQATKFQMASTVAMLTTSMIYNVAINTLSMGIAGAGMGFLETVKDSWAGFLAASFSTGRFLHTKKVQNQERVVADLRLSLNLGANGEGIRALGEYDLEAGKQADLEFANLDNLRKQERIQGNLNFLMQGSLAAYAGYSALGGASGIYTTITSHFATPGTLPVSLNITNSISSSINLEAPSTIWKTFGDFALAGLKLGVVPFAIGASMAGSIVNSYWNTHVSLPRVVGCTFLAKVVSTNFISSGYTSSIAQWVTGYGVTFGLLTLVDIGHYLLTNRSRMGYFFSKDPLDKLADQQRASNKAAVTKPENFLVWGLRRTYTVIGVLNNRMSTLRFVSPKLMNACLKWNMETAIKTGSLDYIDYVKDLDMKVQAGLFGEEGLFKRIKGYFFPRERKEGDSPYGFLNTPEAQIIDEVQHATEREIALRGSPEEYQEVEVAMLQLINAVKPGLASIRFAANVVDTRLLSSMCNVINPESRNTLPIFIEGIRLCEQYAENMAAQGLPLVK